jgi:hypothetical protein
MAHTRKISWRMHLLGIICGLAVFFVVWFFFYR